MSALEQLGRFVAEYNAKSMPAALRQTLRLHVADNVGGWIAAIGTGEGRALIAFRGATRQPRTVADDILLHCALARLSEIDDIHLASMTTAGGIVVPAALAIAAAAPRIEPADLITAIVAGYEVMIRLGAAIDGPAALYRGIWPTYFSAPLGVAAVAARLMRLDGARTAHALALALSTASPGVGHHNAPTTSRWLAVGNAARNGLAAAHAAQAGFTSDVQLLDSPFCKSVYGITPDLAKLNPRDRPALTEVSFKPWCAARQTMAATQALKDILAGGVAAEEIESIEAYVLPPHLKMLDHGVAVGDRASYLTSVPFHLAAAAVTPEAHQQVGFAQMPANGARDRLMARIKSSGDPALLEGYPAAWSARVAVTTAKGRHERTVSHVPGDPAQPLDESELAEKFARFVTPVAGQARVQALWTMALASCEGAEPARALMREIESLCAGQS